MNVTSVNMNPIGDLRRHLKVHSEEKSNKCNQCWYTSSQHTCNLRRHLKTHIGDYEYDGDNEDDEDDEEDLTDVTLVSDDTY